MRKFKNPAALREVVELHLADDLLVISAKNEHGSLSSVEWLTSFDGHVDNKVLCHDKVMLVEMMIPLLEIITGHPFQQVAATRRGCLLWRREDYTRPSDR